MTWNADGGGTPEPGDQVGRSQEEIIERGDCGQKAESGDWETILVGRVVAGWCWQTVQILVFLIQWREGRERGEERG